VPLTCCRICADDADGYHRIMCPAVMGKTRCPLRPDSMKLDRSRPEILTPPGHPPACSTQQTITVPPQVAAKTRQKHDYPSPEHRRSYARRTSAERAFSTIKDPATSNIARGWCRLTGLTPLYLWLACLLTIRNQRILTAWDARQADNARRAAAGLPPKTRRRRRKNPGHARCHPAITARSPPFGHRQRRHLTQHHRSGPARPDPGRQGPKGQRLHHAQDQVRLVRPMHPWQLKMSEPNVNMDSGET
jgi:hypothetical protein